MRAGTFLLTALAAVPWATAQSTTGVCTAVFATSPPAMYVCGQNGKLNPKAVILENLTAGDSLSCGTVCQSNPKCQTFGYNNKTSICNMYSQALRTIGFVANPSSDFAYWNKACITCKAPASTTSTTTSASAPIVTNHGRCGKTNFTAASQTYLRYYMGAGYTIASNNPGNDNTGEPPIVTELTSGSYPNDCTAIQACAALAASRSMVYYSFDLHWFSNTKTWECVQSYDPNKNASYFNVKNHQAYVSYGFYNPDY